MRDHLKSITKASEKKPSLHRSSIKTIIYLIALAVFLLVTTFVFGWTTVEDVPPVLQPYSNIIAWVYPYVDYIQAGLILLFGYMTVKNISEMVYAHMRRRTDHPTAATLRTITRISGIAFLLSLATSIFNVNLAAALTVGSFGGLVVGFATQTILSHVIAGIFLLLTRPFTFGDIITVSGQTGKVKEIKMMHLILESEDDAKEILIPSGTVVTQIIQRKKPPVAAKPIKTLLTFHPPPCSVPAGSTITFTGKLVEAKSNAPIAGAIITIFDSDVERDDHIASGISKSDGCFTIEWVATNVDRWGRTAEPYAKFEGDEEHSASESKRCTIEITR